MKKLGIVAALALVTTIGGVYATWEYKGNAAEQHTENLTNGIKITSATVAGVYGVMDVVSDTLALKIHNKGDYRPAWTDHSGGEGGYLSITYKANVGAPEKIKISYVITISGNAWDENGDGRAETPILNLVGDRTGLAANEILKIDEVDNFTTTPGVAEEVKRWTWNDIVKLDDEDTIGWLEVNDDFTVETYEKYTRYAAAIEGIKITIKMTDVTANTTIPPNV